MTLQLNNEQEKIRLNLIEFLKVNGIMQKWISDKTGISKTSLCLFIQSKRELTEDKLEAIENLIENK